MADPASNSPVAGTSAASAPTTSNNTNTADSELTPTLLSYFLDVSKRVELPISPLTSTLHPFASAESEPPFGALRDITEVASTLSNALAHYSTLNVSDSKFVSLLRQNTTLVESLHASEQDTRKRVAALRSRSARFFSDTTSFLSSELRPLTAAPPLYGEPIPLYAKDIADWCVARIEQWGTAMRMEIFKDEDPETRRTTIVLGGKILALEVDLDRSFTRNSDVPEKLTVAAVKTSLALPSATNNHALSIASTTANARAERSVSLDAFLLRTWEAYLATVQSPPEDDSVSRARGMIGNSMQAARLGRDIQAQLAYLLSLDKLAAREGDSGIRWFSDVGRMCAVTEQVAKSEAEAVASSLQTAEAALDIFLTRVHALALPYLTSASTSFLIHLSPQAYYTLHCLSNSTTLASAAGQLPGSASWKLDIPLAALRTRLSQDSRLPGATLATLSLARADNLSSQFFSQQYSQFPDSILATRPTFRLPGTWHLGTLNHMFPVPPEPPETMQEQSINEVSDREAQDVDGRQVWMLDFTDGGRTPGIVISHTRMREIFCVIAPADPLEGTLGLDMHYPPFHGSWISLLLKPDLSPAECYTAIYRSPTNAHPPLRLRLQAPDEAGFLLGRIPVRSLKEVWGVLEIVRDQCWLNETLKTVQWEVEKLDAKYHEEEDSKEATEVELAAILNGTYKPHFIPVNVSLPYELTYNDELDVIELDDTMPPGLNTITSAASIHEPTSISPWRNAPPPRVVMRFQTTDRLPVHIQVSLTLDPKRRRGVRVNVEGGRMMYPQHRIEELEELARRGAGFGISARVFKWAIG